MPVIGSDLIFEQVPQASGLVLVRRLLAASGDYLVAADVDSILLYVTDLKQPNRRVSGFDGLSISPADVILDPLVTDAWAFDAIGYNFLYALDATAIPDADTIYQLEFLFTPADGSTFWSRWQVETLKVFAAGA